MAGYYGYSMSNNAISAYENGEKPKSKWTKIDILHECENAGISKKQIDIIRTYPIAELRKIGLRKSSWHHTSKYYNTTEFYIVDIYALESIKPYIKSKQTEEPTNERWLVSYIEWEGTRKHPKPIFMEGTGFLKGNWFYLDNGSKKSITSNGFSFVKRI